MRFTYSLQKIVDLKVNEKKQAESNLSLAISRLSVEERQHEELNAKKRSLQKQLAEGSVHKRTVSQMLLTQTYIDYLDEQIQQTEIRIDRAVQHVEASRIQLTDRMVDEKVWSNAREKARLAHIAAMEKRFQDQMEDISASRRRNA